MDYRICCLAGKERRKEVSSKTVENKFQRSGLAALSDVRSPEFSAVFSLLEKEQTAFLKEEPGFRSKEYKWPHDPLHNFSRVWEYPYAYHHLSGYLKTLPENSHPLVADIGSGVTFFPFSLAKLGYRVVCADIDHICEKDLSLARTCVPHSPGAVDFRLIKNSTLPFSDSECDAVYCISVLEHIPEFERTLAEIARILKPKGFCLLTCDINLSPGDGLQLDCEQYARLMSSIEKNFIRIWPERTIHPADLLTTMNSPYPFGGPHLGALGAGFHLLKQRILKPLLGREPGKAIPPPPHVTVLGLVLRKAGSII